MPVVMYPVGSNTFRNFRLRQRLAATLGRRQGRPSSVQWNDYVQWRQSQDAQCPCSQHAASDATFEGFLHCPVPQTREPQPAYMSETVSLMGPGSLKEQMKLGGCYRPWINHGYTAEPLHWAAVKGDEQSVSRILVEHPGRLFATDSEGNTVLMFAGAASYTKNCFEEPESISVLEVILKHCTNDDECRSLVGATNKEGLTALHYAALNGRPDFVRLLLENGADPNAGHKVGNGEKYGLTPLHMSIINSTQGGFECFELLLQKGADTTIKLMVQADGEEGPWSNLRFQCGCGGCWSHVLILFGVVTPRDLDAFPQKSAGPAVSVAVWLRDERKALALLHRQQQIDIDGVVTDECRLLTYAAEDLQISVIQALVEQHANVNIRCCCPQVRNLCRTPLHIILSYKRPHFDVLPCRWCLRYPDSKECTLKEGVDAILRSPECDVDAKDHRGSTPLLTAVRHGYVTCCQSLLDRGANPLARTEWNRCALYYACKLREENVRDELVNLLLRCGVAQDILQTYCSRRVRIFRNSSPLRLVLENRDRKTLVKLYRAGAVNNNTLKILYTRVNVADNTADEQSRQFRECLEYLLGNMNSLLDSCLHYLSTQAGCGSPSVREERFRRLSQNLNKDYGEAAYTVVLFQRSKTLNLL